MAIKFIPDLGAPLTVIAVDLIVDSQAPDYAKWATGIMAVGGFVGSYLNKGGDYVKNIGIAALPAFGKNLYDYARGMGCRPSTSGRMAFKRAAARATRYPAPAQETPFQGVKLT